MKCKSAINLRSPSVGAGSLLRRICKGFLEMGAARKHLLYALSEILLVVIGILIVLQINNWNNERINRLEEKNYLHRIVKYLETDLLDLNWATTPCSQLITYYVYITYICGQLSGSNENYNDNPCYVGCWKFTQSTPHIFC